MKNEKISALQELARNMAEGGSIEGYEEELQEIGFTEDEALDIVDAGREEATVDSYEGFMQKAREILARPDRAKSLSKVEIQQLEKEMQEFVDYYFQQGPENNYGVIIDGVIFLFLEGSMEDNLVAPEFTAASVENLNRGKDWYDIVEKQHKENAREMVWVNAEEENSVILARKKECTRELFERKTLMGIGCLFN